jgi:cell wall-associated NlpC family hydrolase
MSAAITESVNPSPAWAADLMRRVAETLVRDRTPFVHRGRGPAGLDCLGLVLWLHGRVGVVHELTGQEGHYTSSYFRQGGDALYLRGIATRCVPVATPATGDLVLFRAQGSAVNVGHVGVVYDPSTAGFVHAFYARGVRFDRWTDRAWSKQVAGFMRPKAFATLAKERQ